MTPEQVQAIANLRARNVAPKQIARQLGLRPAEVTAVIKAQAENATADRLTAGELHPIFQCLVNQNCLPGLTAAVDAPIVTPVITTIDATDGQLVVQDTEDAATTLDSNSGSGFAMVSVARNAGFNRIEVCTMLVDIWCLGVKDAAAVRKVDPTTYKDFVDFAYQPIGEIEEISLE